MPVPAGNPIVFVTKKWEGMCGFTYEEAVGRNCRVTQGERTDPAAIELLSGAVKQQRSSKVLLLNYRRGLPDRPFWNLLSINPVVHRGSLMLYMANLQDYTYAMTKMVRLAPAQFCRSAEHHQQPRAMPRCVSDGRALSRPGPIEMDSLHLERALNGSGGAPRGDGPVVKRLGWAELELEPEHLVERVRDALEAMEARYDQAEPTECNGDEVFVVNADVNGVAARVLVTHDDDPSGAGPGTYRITCARLGGDTFAYHAAFRQLRELLADAVHGGGTSLLRQ